MGFCYEKLKDISRAKECYEKYLAKAPLSPDTEKIKEKINKMTPSLGSVDSEMEEGFIDKIMKLFGK